jgi:uncharacterized membrane protein
MTKAGYRTAFARVTLACAAVASLSNTASAGELFLLGLVPQAYADDCSEDGRVVVGYDPQSYWYWTRETGVVQLIGQTVPPGNSVGGQGCMSADGRTMSCSTLQDFGGLLKAEGTQYDIQTTKYRPLGNLGFHCDSERNSVWGMSNDAVHVVGLMEQAFCDAIAYYRNTQTGQLVNLGTLYFYKPSRANDVSDDGSTICGWNDDYVGWRQGAVWRRNADGTYTQTNMAAGAIKMSEAGCVSGNGQWVYGIGRTGYSGGAMWRWSAATGVQPVGTNPSTGNGYAVATNYDGSKVLCFYGIMGSSGSYMWTAENGYTSLATLAANAGVQIPDGWQLNLPLGMSDDGLTIVGTASGPVGTSPFILDLRPSSQPCTADLDGDGEVGAPDLAMLLSSWGALGGSADLNGDGEVGAADLTAILSAWGPCA